MSTSDWVGSWRVNATVVKQNATFPGLMTFFSDGNVMADESPNPQETSGHGSWARTGPNEGVYTFVFLIGSPEPGRWTRGTVKGKLEYSSSTDEWRGPFEIVVVDQGGQEVVSDTGTLSGQRITALNVASQPHDPVAVVRAMDAACNAGDLEGVLALFADDAVLTEPVEHKVYTGKPHIQEWFQPSIGHYRVVSTDHRVRGDTVTWRATLTGHMVQQMGSESLEEAAEAAVWGGKITSFVLTITGRKP